MRLGRGAWVVLLALAFLVPGKSFGQNYIAKVTKGTDTFEFEQLVTGDPATGAFDKADDLGGDVTVELLGTSSVLFWLDETFTFSSTGLNLTLICNETNFTPTLTKTHNTGPMIVFASSNGSLTVQNVNFNGGGTDLSTQTNGGIFKILSPTATFENCSFSNCYVNDPETTGSPYSGGHMAKSNGGAIAHHPTAYDPNGFNPTPGSLTLTNCTFDHCQTTSGAVANSCQGGAVYFCWKNNTSSNLTISGCQFTDCFAERAGGAVYVEGDCGTVTLEGISVSGAETINTEFTRCTTNGDGGAFVTQTPKLTCGGNCTFTDCEANSGNGGAIRITATPTAARPQLITNSTFTRCKASTGGAIRFDGTAPAGAQQVDICTFDACSSTSNGGAIWANGGLEVICGVTVARTSFTSCLATNDGAHGGAIFSNGTLSVNNAEFLSCTAHGGGAIWTANALTVTNSSFGDKNDSTKGCKSLSGGSDLEGGAIHVRSGGLTLNGYPVGVGGGQFGGAREDGFYDCTSVGHGGAVYVHAGSMTINNDANFTIAFEHCKTTVDRTSGGAVCTKAGAFNANSNLGTLRFYDCDITASNSSYSNDYKGGGAIAALNASNGTVNLNNNSGTIIFDGCDSKNYGPSGAGAIHAGAGFSATNNSGSITFANCTAKQVTGYGCGGALYVEAGNCTMTANTNNPGTVAFSNCRTESNSGNGGAICHLYGATASGTMTIENATFTQCKTNAVNSNGGVIYTHSNNVTLKGCALYAGTAADSDQVTTASAGGAIYQLRDVYDYYVQSGSLKLENVEICGFHAPSYAGGVFSNVQNLSMDNVTIKNCKTNSSSYSQRGGAVNTLAYNATIRNCNFFAGTDTNSTVTTAGEGGAILFRSGTDNTTKTVEGCNFYGYQAYFGGGAIMLWGYPNGALKIKNTNFYRCKGSMLASNNDRKCGSVVYVLYHDSGKPFTTTIDGCHFYAGGDATSTATVSSARRGGAIYVALGSLTVKNTEIHGYKAYESSSFTEGEGGAICHDGTASTATLTIENTTFRRCLAGPAGKGGVVFTKANNATITGCHFYAGADATASAVQTAKLGGAIYQEGGSTLTLTDTDIYGFQCSASDGQGGGVYTKAQSMTLNGLAIQNCKAASQGGGIYAPNATTVNMKNTVDVSNNTLGNTTIGNAAGLYLPQQSVVINVTSDTQTANLYIYDNKTSDNNQSNLRMGTTSPGINIKNSVIEETEVPLTSLTGKVGIVNPLEADHCFAVSQESAVCGASAGSYFKDDSGNYTAQYKGPGQKRIVWVSATPNDPVCKITDDLHNLLYYASDPNTIVEAKFANLDDAFGAFGDPLRTDVFFADAAGNTPATPYHIEMTVAEYTQTSSIPVPGNPTVVLTTDLIATNNTPCTIKRSGFALSMYVIDASDNFVLKDIVIDGQGGLMGENTGNIEASQTGGIVRASGSSRLTLDAGCVLQNSKSSQNGAAVVMGGTSTLVVNCGVTIQNCSGVQGGGVYVGGSASMNATGGTFTGLAATTNGGGLYVAGSASLKDVQISGCTQTTEATDANDNGGGGIALGTAATVTLDNASITGCVASRGGGIYSTSTVADNALVLKNGTSVTGNLANGNGVYAAGVHMKDGCTITFGDAAATQPDNVSIKDNLKGGQRSDLRLAMNTSGNNAQSNPNSVKVLSELSGEIFILNPGQNDNQFGVENTAKTYVVNNVFQSGYTTKTTYRNNGNKLYWKLDVACRITDANGNLLKYKNNNNTLVEAKYYDLTTAFSDFEGTTFYNAQGTSVNPVNIEMLLDSYELEGCITYPTKTSTTRNVTLKTASTLLASDTSVIYRGKVSVTDPMFKINKANISITLNDIVIDGQSDIGLWNAYTYSVGDYRYYGGAFWVKSGAMLYMHKTVGGTKKDGNALIRNCKAHYGGGVYFDYGVQNKTLELAYWHLENCTAVDNGGGVYSNCFTGGLTVTGSSFKDCSSPSTDQRYGYGAAIYFDYPYVNGQVFASSLAITNSSFERCHASKTGAVYYTADTYTANVSHSTFTDCSSSAIYLKGGGETADALCSATFTDCTFTGCSGAQGGGILMAVSFPDLG